MNSLSETLRSLREEYNLPLKTISENVNIDQAVLCKIEKGQRRPTREQVIKLAEYYKIRKKELLVAWLSDRVLYEVGNEPHAMEALKVAEEKVKYHKKKQR